MLDVVKPRPLASAATAIAGLMCGWLALLQLRMIVSPAPQEMREGGIVWITRLLLDGRNPYAVAELPASTNVYGILYHLVVMPFARVFGNGFTVHRAISALAIVGSCVLVHRMLRREKTDQLLAAVGVMLFYASSVYFVAPLARPDALGVLLCLGSMSVLFREQLTWRRFLIGLAFGLLALLTKIYLAYPPFIVAAYVFAFESRRRGVLFAATTIAAAIGVLLMMTVFYPAYITVSVIANTQTTTYYDVGHMRQQTVDWFVFSLPLTIGLLLTSARIVRDRLLRRSLVRPSMFAFAATVNAVAFFAWFGGHPGAHMTYLFHLVTPVLMLALLPRLAGTAWPRTAVAGALPIALALSAHYFPLTFGRFTAAEATFARLTKTIDTHATVLGSTETAGLLALAGRPVIDSGHSQYFGDAAVDQQWPGLVPADIVHARWNGFLAEDAEGIVTNHYDLIIRSRRPGLIPTALVSDHYVRTGTMELDFVWGAQHWPVDLWEPRRK
jgi:hypothetical protein